MGDNALLCNYWLHCQLFGWDMALLVNRATFNLNPFKPEPNHALPTQKSFNFHPNIKSNDSHIARDQYVEKWGFNFLNCFLKIFFAKYCFGCQTKISLLTVWKLAIFLLLHLVHKFLPYGTWLRLDWGGTFNWQFT